MEITDRGLLYPVVGIAAATCLVLSVQLLSGRFPHPIVIANLYLVGLGVGLVVARLGKLGPYGGFLGTPWKESAVKGVIARESARAQRFGRSLTVVGIKAASPLGYNLCQVIRATDQIIGCRDGWKIIVLPETDREGAQMLLRRLQHGPALLSAVVEFDHARPRQQLDIELMQRLQMADRSSSAQRRNLAQRESKALAS